MGDKNEQPFDHAILYVHPQCPHCLELLKHIDEIREVILKYVKKFTVRIVDDQFFAFDLTATPTLIIDGIVITGITLEILQNEYLLRTMLEGREDTI